MSINTLHSLKDIDLSRPVIFYGAGRYAPSIAKALQGIGIHPACYVDRSTSKQGTGFMGRDILSLNEAIRLYPDCLVYITTTAELWEDIERDLMVNGGIGENRILNKKIGRKYISCTAWEHEITTQNHLLLPCCVPNQKKPRIEINFNDYDETIERYLAFRDASVEQLNSDNPPEWCTGCPFLTEEYRWIDSGKFYFLNTTDTFVCQFNCCYCSYPSKNNKTVNSQFVDFSQLLQALEKRNLLCDDFQIRFASGEIAANPQCDSILDAISKYSADIFTNAGIYNEKILRILDNRNSSITVSMDSGTRETFAKIKGKDAFDKVCDNLVKYASRGGRIKLKYILLPGINDNIDDADGFIALGNRINADRIILSKDSRKTSGSRTLSKQTIDIANHICGKAKTHGRDVSAVTAYFNEEEIAQINI